MTDQLSPVPEDWTRGMAIIAHPDDVEYGASAAIARWTDAGKEFAYVLATRGEAGIDTLDPATCGPIREAEERASAAVVGVETVEFLDHPDGVIEDSLALRRDLVAAIRRHRPEFVLTLNHHDTWPGGQGWNTPDHRAVGRATLDAAGAAGNRWIFPELVEQGLDPWGGVRWVAVYASPHATHAVDVGDHLERAVASLLEHRSYLEVITDQDAEAYARALLVDSAVGSGERFGGRPAVTVELVGF